MLFDSFQDWLEEVQISTQKLYEPVLRYEITQKSTTEEEIWEGVARAYQVMKEAVETGLTQNMQSRSGMVNNSGKKVAQSQIHVLSPEFTLLVSAALGAKEVNSCMGRVVAAPTAGASGILPGVLTTAQKLHKLSDRTIHEGLLVASGIALIIEYNASLAGAVGGCQAETGSAACMASGALVYMLGGEPQQVFNAVGIVIQCMLGLVCDPVAGLVEVPCVVRNASAASIAYAAAQMALSHVDAVIPVDECVLALAEVGQNMETMYKETALGGLAATPTGKAISKRVLIQDIEMLDGPENPA
jgi:L-serine dehydratase